MAKITYIEHNAKSHTLEVANGLTVMEGAIQNNISGIDADCGGGCACATCHVYVQDDFMAKVGEANDMEKSMLDFADGVEANSRLSCQITVNDELSGMRVKMPESQG